MIMGQTPGGVPISHNALQHYPEFHGADTWGGTLSGPAGGGATLPGQDRGIPCWGVPYQGGTQVGHPPGQVRMGGTLPGGYPARGQVGYPPGQVRMGGYPVRTTEGVLTTRRAVCLLRSRRRTFLFYFNH